jgi:hypothetical protein
VVVLIASAAAMVVTSEDRLPVWLKGTSGGSMLLQLLLCPSKSKADRGGDVPVYFRAILKSAPCAAGDGAQTR